MNLETVEPLLLEDGQRLGLTLDNFGRLVVETPDGVRMVGVEPVRAFPLTDPSNWISFCDSDGRELVSLRSTRGLSPECLEILQEELAIREFVPVITKIIRISAEGLPADWDVETDRGPTRFTLDTEDDVRRVCPTRVLITDSRKMRFQVLDTNRLDNHSRRILERFS